MSGPAIGAAGRWSLQLGLILARAAVDGPWRAAAESAPVTALPPADALPSLLLLAIAVFAIVGYLRGFGKEWLSVVAISFGYWLLDQHWAFIAAWANRLHKMFVFAVVERGVFADDPGAAWGKVGAAPGVIGDDGRVLLWQIVFFTAVVLIAYVVSSVVGREPCAGALHIFNLGNLLSRALGGLVGGWSGFLIGWFYLERLLPGQVPEGGMLADVAHAVLQRIGPMLVLGAVVVLIVFGVLSLGGRNKRVYT